MTWWSMALGDGPVRGPEGQSIVQCHARSHDVRPSNGEYFRCQNWKKRRNLGIVPADEWLCHAHDGIEVAFTDDDPCRCDRRRQDVRLMGYSFHPVRACPFYGTRTVLREGA